MLLEARRRTHLSRGRAGDPHGGREGGGLTQQLLAFSRQQVLELRIADRNEHIAAGMDKCDAAPPGRRRRGSSDAGRWAGEESRGRLSVQIEQVITESLRQRARDAMPSGGTLRISTVSVDLDRKPMRQAACRSELLAPLRSDDRQRTAWRGRHRTMPRSTRAFGAVLHD